MESKRLTSANLATATVEGQMSEMSENLDVESLGEMKGYEHTTNKTETLDACNAG